MAIKLNIQLFGDAEGALNPASFNKLSSQYDSDVPNVNRTFINNQDALQILKNVAGSPRLSNDTRNMVTDLNTAIEETANYFDSVRAWADDVVSTVHSILGAIGLSPMAAVIDRTVLDQINENFDNGSVGVENFSDVDTYVSSIKSEVIPTLRNGVGNITADVREADRSLPAEVHQSLGATVDKSNEFILNGYDKASTYLTEHLDVFKRELQRAITDMATAARGGK